MTKIYDVLESISELKLRIYGDNIAELFQNALIAMFDAVEPVYDQNKEECLILISITAADRDQLLIDFLSTALFYADTKNLAFYDAVIDNLTDTAINATIKGRSISSFDVEIKAVTYHNVFIKENDEGFSVEIIFDI